ncbi:MAG: hypothetical protein LBU04_04510 [Christensenellaceae bacterium]|jgi:hypothetical protein|nr:hypothetical protein [Christensenellaceae bacterium]
MAKTIKNLISLISIAIILLLVFFVINISNGEKIVFASTQSLDTTTPQNPYIVSTVADWNNLTLNWSMRDGLDNDSPVYVRLSNNISFENSTFNRLGTDSYPYYGTFDGNGKILTNITYSVTDADENIGVFGVIGEGAVVKNLGIYNATIEGNLNTGALAGSNFGSIVSCFANASIISNGINGGGLVGYNEGSIKTTYTSGSITYAGIAPTVSNLGGIVGKMQDGELSYSYTIIAHFGNVGNIGGIAGFAYNDQPLLADKTRIEYSFFANEIFGANKTIGNKESITFPTLNAYGNFYIESSIKGGNNGLNNVRFNDTATDGAWQNEFKMTDGSAFFGPNLVVFSTTTESRDLSFNSTIVRRFGAFPNATGTWGSEVNNPYVISSPEHFRIISQAVYNPNSQTYTTYAGKYFYIDQDIDFSNFELTPIGTDAHRFMGILDGGGHTLSNIKWSAQSSVSRNDLAIFRYVGRSGQISNINIDASCEFNGDITVASLVARLDGGTISNIFSEATVSGSNFVGGIVGQATNAARVSNCLSRASVSITDQSSTNYYGIIATTGAIVVNSWFVTQVGTAMDYAKEGGPNNSNTNLLVIGTEGTVEANLQGGVISFQATQGSSFKPVFRTFDETTVPASTAGMFVPTVTDVGRSVYLRFVKDVSLDDAQAEGITSIAFRRPQNIETTDATEFYNGQLATIIAKIEIGYTLTQNYYVGGSNEKIEITDFNILYVRESSTSQYIYLTVSFFITQSMQKVGIITSKMFETLPSLSREYDGIEESYIYDGDLDLTGNSINYSYSTGTIPPVDAGINYTLTVDVLRGVSVIGRSVILFDITPKKIPMPDDVFYNPDANHPYKEFDGTTSIWLDTYVNEDMFFSYLEERDLQFLNVTAQAFYVNSQIGTNYDAEFEFNFTGMRAHNYDITPKRRTIINLCEITKRKLTIDVTGIDEVTGVLTRTYTGSTIQVAGAFIGANKPITGFPFQPLFLYNLWDSVNNEAVGNNVFPIDVSTYLISIQIASNPYYNISLKRDRYLLEIIPAEINVEFYPLDIIYVAGGQHISASFEFNGNNYTGNIGDIEYYYIDNDYESKESIMDAGTYLVVIERLTQEYKNFKIKINDDGSARAYTEITVTKRTPEININPISVAYGDTDATLSWFGDDFDDYDGEITFRVSSGSAATISKIAGDWYLLPISAGNITIICELAETRNYTSNTATTQTSVSKKSLDVQLKAIDKIVIGYGDRLILDDSYLVFGDQMQLPDGYVPPRFTIGSTLYTADDYLSITVTTYTVVIDWTNVVSNNYELNFSGTNTFTLEITCKDIYIKIDEKSRYYGDADIPLTYSVYSDEKYTDRIDESVYLGKVEISLIREIGQDASDYIISASSISSDSDFAILNSDSIQSAIYRINKLPIIVIVAGVYTKVYGTQDPVISNTSITVRNMITNVNLTSADIDSIIGSDNTFIQFISRENGENAGQHSYFLLPIPNYSNNYVFPVLAPISISITPADPEFEFSSGMVEYGDRLSDVIIADFVNAIPHGNGNPPEGVFTWLNGNIIPDFSLSQILEYSASFTSTTPNYKDATFTLSVIGIKRELTVEFSDMVDTLTYMGVDLARPFNYVINNALPGDNVNESIRYLLGGNSALLVKNAGIYTAEIVTNNQNYAIAGNSTFTFTVQKVALTITIEDLEFTEGESPTYTYKYIGLVGQDIENQDFLFTSYPNVSIPLNAGKHIVRPRDAMSSNYNISYADASVTVYKTRLYSENNYLSILGKFDPLIAISVTEVTRDADEDTYADILSTFNAYNMANGTRNKSLGAIYSFRASIDGRKTVVDTGVASLNLPDSIAKYASGTLSIVYIKDGIMYSATNVSLNGSSITFDLEDCEYFAIVVPVSSAIDSLLILYICLGAGGGTVLIALIILIIRKSRIKKEKIKHRKKLSVSK